MKHLRNTAVELTKDLRKNGLKGVCFFEADVNGPTSPEDDDLGVEAAAAWDRDYCCINLEPDTDTYCENDYVCFDYEGFRDDLHQKFEDYFGPEIFEEMKKATGRSFDWDSISGEIEIYRRRSPWHDLQGNEHPNPVIQ